MALTKKTIPLTFRAGVSTSEDPKISGKTLLKAVDAIFPRKGAVGKRTGTKSLAGTHDETHMATYKGRPVALEHTIKVEDGADITGGTMTQVDTLSMWETSLERTQVPEGEQRMNAEVLEQGNVRVWAYARAESAGYDLFIESYEANSGRLLDSTQVTAPSFGTNPQCRIFFLDGSFHFFYVLAGELWRGEVDPTTGTIAGAVGTGLLLWANAQQLDGAQVDDSSVILAGRNNAGTHLRVAAVDVDAGSNTGREFAATDVDAVGVWKRDDGSAVIGYYRGTPLQLRFMGVDKTLAVDVPDTLVHTMNPGEIVYNLCGMCEDAVTGNMFYTWVDAVSQPVTFYAVLDVSGAPAVTSYTEILRKATVASKPIDDTTAGSGNIYIWVTFDSQKYAYLIDQAGVHSAKALPGLIEGSTTTTPVANYFVPRISGTAPWSTALRYRPTVGAMRAPVMASVERPGAVHCLEAQGQLLIPGSIPQQFDGEDVTEMGFLHVPETVTGLVPGPAGNLAAGSFRGMVVYEDRDTGNVLHRSSPSIQSAAVVSAGSDRIEWTIPYLQHTNRTNVRVVFYRNSVTGGGVSRFFRHPRGEFDNETGLDSFVFTDGTVAADDNITAQPTIYIDGNVLANIQPPGGAIQAEHQGRHFIVEEEYPGTRVRYSKPYAQGIAVEHAALLYLDVPPEGGDITALWSSSSWLVVAKASRLYAYSGTGLTNTLLGTNYGNPYLLSEAIGCTNQKTVVLVPGGVMFQAEDRIWLLAGRAVKPIGDAVRFWTDPRTERTGAPLVIIKAVHLPAQSLVIFLTDGDALVYNYLYGQWATWTAHEATDGTEAGGVLFFKVASDDTVRLDDSTTYLDGTSPVVLTIETGWLSFAGLLGYKRIYRMLLGGQNITAHTLIIKLAFDLEPTWVDSLSFDSTALVRFGAEAHMGAGTTNYQGQGYQVEIRPSRQKCTSIRVQIKDDDPTGSGQSYDVTGLSFVAGLKTGTARRGSRRRAS